MALTIENHVYREGEGIPLILVHGFPVDHRMWDRCATALMEMSDAQECTQYPIWAPDMPGAGASPVPRPEDSGARAEDGALPDALDLMADAYVLCNIDYRAALEEHIASGCDITMLATKETQASPIHCASVMNADSARRVTSYALDCPAKPGDYASMGHMIISREFLINVIRDYTSRGIYDFLRDFIQHEFNRGRLSINLYEVNTTVLRIRNVEEYFQNSLAILNDDVADALFRGDRPIHTRVTDEVPAYYGLDAQVERAVIADGCFIDGSVEDCVLSRGVKVGKGAKLKNCVIMQGSVVGEGASLENVIVDKWVTISDGAQLKGLDSTPVVIRKGVTV